MPVVILDLNLLSVPAFVVWWGLEESLDVILTRPGLLVEVILLLGILKSQWEKLLGAELRGRGGGGAFPFIRRIFGGGGGGCDGLGMEGGLTIF